MTNVKPHQHAHFARQIERFKLIGLRGAESLRICTEYSSYFSRRFCRLRIERETLIFRNRYKVIEKYIKTIPIVSNRFNRCALILNKLGKKIKYNERLLYKF